MPRHIVHVGYHKTATNWFQRVFYPAVTNLRYVHRKKARRAFLSDSGLKFDPSRAWQALEAERAERLAMCEEELSGNIHTAGLHGCFTKEIARRIREVLPDSDIVIFVRNQVEMIASVYKQYIKEGGTFSVNRYLYHGRYLPESGFQPAKAPLFSFDHFDYAALVGWYDSLFGEAHVHVFPYEAFARDNSAFLREFAARFDLDVDLEALRRSRPNPPYGRAILPLARLLNRFSSRDVLYKRYFFHVPGMYKYGGMLAKHLNRLPWLGRQITPESLLGQETVRYIREFYPESNRRLAQRMGESLADYGYPL